MQNVKTPKKLIEVALPLDDINAASAREKSIRHGHPSTLHLWWARRPLAAARAVIFAQMVNDPGGDRGYAPGMTKAQAQLERERLFGIMRRLVTWENTNDGTVLAEARAEIIKSWVEICEQNKSHPQARELFAPARLPAFHDPFAGGGALPLEAQRLGLESFASDLNPVPVLINKAMIEIPPIFAGRRPVGDPLPSDQQMDLSENWAGTAGFAADVRRYGEWVRSQALECIGHLYPSIDLPSELGRGKATVIAWIWARTVRSPNPAFGHAEVPLASTFILASKPGKEAYVEPVVDGDSYRFEIRSGKPPASAKSGTKVPGKGSGFVCILSNTSIDGKYIKEEAQAGRMGVKLLAIVAEGQRGRIYLPPSEEHEKTALQAKPEWVPTQELVGKARDQMPLYGMNTFGDLFTSRQAATLSTFSDLIHKSRQKIAVDAAAAGMDDDPTPLRDGGRGAVAYAEAISVYLAFIVEKMAETHSSLCTWSNAPKNELVVSTFRRQAIAMTWDFAESNPFARSSGSVEKITEAICRVLPTSIPASASGSSSQANAQAQSITAGKVVSTDPPYYDNICYADLSDFFYVWLRRTLRPVFPDLFATLSVPKLEELVASPYREDLKGQAEEYFLSGMTSGMRQLAKQAHPAFPTTIYYAFKQSDTTDLGTGNTGWETFLEAVLQAGFAITGTWPIRTERDARSIGIGANALASSIVLVCRQREANAPSISRREFLRELKEQLAEAIEVMIGGSEGVSPVAPVDLAQAVIGPGMGIFSKYAAVLEADGTEMTVHTALTLINRMLVEGEDDFDSDTQFCMSWFDEQGWAAGDFGKADVLARAKGTSVERVRQAGVALASSGKVKLLKPLEYPSDWLPEKDNNTPVWEALHQLIRALRAHGEAAAGSLLARMPQRAEPIRNLAYRLYTLCERKGWAEDARAYNELITSWASIDAASHEKGHIGSQADLDI
ncbi:DUF1156 domain-containing protein [Massilia forsythiae]|uniref:DUF1156 domain-containing protein n=1 Tax=Massilia forsythiae TaxID=2728020 RepID=A0A7Z2W120_9BURK|nr:DUF1156 domain-containing protein [Massilia forsythiae]QJE02497.1 DUF1156 domain-containing protein [Massilia forsythiae]